MSKHTINEMLPAGPDRGWHPGKSALFDGGAIEVSTHHKRVSCQDAPHRARVTAHCTLVASKSPVFADLGTEAVMLDPRNGRYYRLDDVGRTVWNLLQQPTNALQIRAVLVKEYAVEPRHCARDILAFLQELADAELVDVMD